MHYLLSRLAARSGALFFVLLAGCSADPGPSCTSEDAQATLQKLLWGEVDKQFAPVGPQNADAFASLARKYLQIQLSGITTVEAPQGGTRVATCQATMTTAMPESLKADLGLVRAALAREPGSTKLEGGNLTGQVEYLVGVSDDKKSVRVEARGYRTYAEVLAGVTQALYAESAAPQGAAPQPQRSGSAGSAEAATSTPVPEQPVASYEEADKALNEAYQAARASMSEQQKAALRDEQRAWIKRRDEACSEAAIEREAKGNVSGGTAMQAEQLACKANLATQRTKELRAAR
jgi:uncharacterized protein YecT (DUF1311 family)